MELNDASDTLSPQSPNNSHRKCNVSFSFNFDVDGIDSDHTTDSDAPNLQIDVSEVINYENPKKRKFVEIEEASTIDEMEEEIERQLDAKAAKTNLTATNVKNILRHVITNEHVLAMVQNSLHNTEEGGIFEPKLTRAKAKELAIAPSNIPWPITPVKQCASSEVQALISEDFHEDSSDEEYNPDQDQQSEDDSEHLATSDIDSQPSTPAPVNVQIPEEKGDCPSSIDVHYDSEGVFKIPSVPNVRIEEKIDEAQQTESIESIGQRTRSKLSLSETPLEQIEQAFIPPDIPTDRYDWDWEMDEEWNKFLADFTQPLTHELNTEDDPEADPEYNILEDRENDMLDIEEIRDDRAVKVSRKELKDLVAELFEDEDFFSMGPNSMEQEEEELQWKKKSVDVSTVSVHNNSTDNPMVKLLPALAEPELPKIVDFEHSNLIAIQFQQHIQLMVQHFVMTYQHPELHSQSITCKDNLNSIAFLRTGETSAFDVLNLPDALALVDDWEKKFKNEKFRNYYVEMQTREIKETRARRSRKLRHTSSFHPEVVKVFMESRALMYPALLPYVPMMITDQENYRHPYLRSEEYLLAIGLEQFLPFHEERERKFSSKKMIFMDAIRSICEFLMPARHPKPLYGHAVKRRYASDDNPIKYYYQMGYIPSRIHCIALDNIARAPKDQPPSIMPKEWRRYCGGKYLDNNCSSIVQYLSESTDHITIHSSYLSPAVNMFPNMPNLDQTPPKNSSQSVEDEPSPTFDNALTSPQLRQTTPRLAKIRSAQNMKLMTQVSGPKSSLSPSIKSRKGPNRKTSEISESSRGDNEDEIAELMLASTTIRKDSVNRKKAKQVREQENLRRLREAESDLVHEERTTKFAASFFQKIHTNLEANNSSLLKTAIKLFTDYNEKIDGMKEQSLESQDKLAINFYKDLGDTFKDHPDMTSDLILFLKPHQAAMIGKSSEYTMTQKMVDFVNAAQVYFTKQPAKLNRLMQAVTQTGTEPKPTLASMHSLMDPVLKGHPIVKDLYQSCIPCEKPPESLFQPHLFENLTCQIGPYDKHKVYTDNSPEFYENIELSTPPTQEDPYGGDNCKCICHANNSSPTKTSSAEHCISCGVRYLNGRIYLQTSEGLRPAKVTFPGDDDEKLENILRVSLKTSERFSPATSTGRRRKSSKNESPDEPLQRHCTVKNSPNKESEEGTKTKRNVGGKSPPKFVDQRRLSKCSDTSSVITTQSLETSPIKSKREKRAERREAKSDAKNCNLEVKECNMGEKSAGTNEEESTARMDVDCEEVVRVDTIHSEVNATEQTELQNSKEDNDNTVEPEDTEKPWSRQEDAVLLKHVQKNYSEKTFVLVSGILEGRSVEHVKKRCEVLLALLEKMV